MSKKEPAKKQRKETAEIKDDVNVRLASFHVIPNKRSRTFFSLTPALLVLLVVMDWLIGNGAFSRDTFRMTAIMTVALLLVAIQILFDRLPKALDSIWKRNIIEGVKKDPSPLLNYIERFETSLNSNHQGWLSLLFAVGGLLATYPFRYWIVGGEYPFNLTQTILYYFGGQAAVIAPVLGIFLGVLVWRVSVIAYYIGDLGEKFSFKVQVNHLDQSGGLKPIGNLAFNIAIIILIPSIFFAVWGFITTFFDTPGLQGYIALWGSLYRQLLLILIFLSFFAFIQPLNKIHQRMDAYAQMVQAELDGISAKIEALSHELRTQADTLPPGQGEEKLHAIEFMKKVYNQNSHIPTWPFDTKTLIQFGSAQVVPILSLLGTSGSMVDLIKGILNVVK